MASATKTDLPAALSSRHRGALKLATDEPQVEHVPVDDIRADGGTQMRAGLNRETVEEYAEAMREQDGWGQFPPATVYHDGTTYWLADGFHRVAAAKAAGLEAAPAKIHAGDRRAAILHAAGANADHGLRRTNADKWRSVETLLADREWNGWSDRDIARACHVSNTFVGNVRAKLGNPDRPQYAPPPVPVDASLSTVDSENAQRTYTTRHGTVAKMNTAKIGANQPTYAPVWLLESAIKEWMRKAGYGDHDLLLNKLVAKTSGVNTPFGELQADLLRQSIHHRKHDLVQAINNVIAQRATAARQAQARAVYVEPEPAPATLPQTPAEATPPDCLAAGYAIVPEVHPPADDQSLGAVNPARWRWVDRDGEHGDWWPYEQAVEDARKRIELAPQAAAEPTPTARADDDRWPALKAAGYTYKHVGKNMWAIVHEASGYESAWRYDPADCIPLAAAHYADEQAAIAIVAAETAEEDAERAARDATRAPAERAVVDTTDTVTVVLPRAIASQLLNVAYMLKLGEMRLVDQNVVEQALRDALQEPDLRQIAAILEYAKRMAQRARQIEPSLNLQVTNVVPPLSQLINAAEKKVKHAE